MSETRRHVLYEELKEVLSVDSAHELIDALPPVGWGEVATKADLTLIRHEVATQGAELRGEMATMGAGLLREMERRFAEMERRFGEVDGRFGELVGRFGSMDGRFGEVDGRFGELDGRFGELEGHLRGMRGELLAEIANAKDSMRVWTIATLITLVLGMAGIILSMAQFRR